MRIRGYGSGGGGGFGNQSRSDTFRKKHRLGQKVKGRLIKNLPDGLAWVDIDGDSLVAQLNSPRPEGTRLTFLIKQLVPEIILKEMFLSDSAMSGTLQVIRSFDAARTLFENAYFETQRTPGVTYMSAEAFFLELSQIPRLHVLYADVLDCAASISKALRAAGKGTIAYHPWLTLSGRRQVTHVKSNGADSESRLTETIVEFDHTQFGLTRAVFLQKGAEAGFRLLIQHTAYEKDLREHFTHPILTGQEIAAQCIGVGKLPPTAHGGLLNELFFSRR